MFVACRPKVATTRPAKKMRNAAVRAVMACQAVAYCLSGQAGSVDLYLATGSSAGVRSHVNKSVTSIRERKFINLVEQRFDFSCGAAAVATILKYAYRRDIDEIRVVEGMMAVSDEELVREKGFSLLDVRHYVETLGLRGRGYQVLPASLHEVRIPTIVLLDIQGYKHFVVLRRVVGERVFVADPALGNRVMTLDDFRSSWNGTLFAIVGGGFDRSTALSRPEPPLTMDRFWYDKAPITDSELLDFGFQHAELF